MPNKLGLFIDLFCDGKMEITVLMDTDKELNTVLFSGRIEELLLREDLEHLLKKEIWWFEPTGQRTLTITLLESE